MNTYADQPREKTSQPVIRDVSQQKSDAVHAAFTDNRAGSIAQRKMREAISNSAKVKQLKTFADMALQRKQNATGLPDTLKTGVENLSGHSLDDVKVHYNSSRPAQLGAHAYAQGTDIHVAPGQEKHLPHEAWHVVQQKQGRVKATMQLKAGVPVNDDPVLEDEADAMGAKAMSAPAQMMEIGKEDEEPVLPKMEQGPAQMMENTEEDEEPVQGKFVSVPPITSGTTVAQRVLIAGIDVSPSGGMPTWDQNGLTYHINLTSDTYHITKEDKPRTHYYFSGFGAEIADKQPTKEERGGGKSTVKTVFSSLPREVQSFIKTNFKAIISVE